MSLVKFHKAQLKAAVYGVLERRGCLCDQDIIDVLKQIQEEFEEDA